MYGGTSIEGYYSAQYRGLSPRVRGNLNLLCVFGMDIGSIPACTGEPPAVRSTYTDLTVYPRVYGGTAFLVTMRDIYNGLSPRVRGNRVYQGLSLKCCRSIPACTGEPGLQAHR